MTDDWPTPRWLKRCFPRWFDPCPLKHLPDPSNPEDWDGLQIPWPPKTFINPPFSLLSEFVDHGLEQPRPQVWFVPNRPEAKWFQRLIAEGGQAAYFTTRVYKGSNFGSALIFLSEK